jgi:hypothetical protein
VAEAVVDPEVAVVGVGDKRLALSVFVIVIRARKDGRTRATDTITIDHDGGRNEAFEI